MCIPSGKILGTLLFAGLRNLVTLSLYVISAIVFLLTFGGFGLVIVDVPSVADPDP